MRYEVIQYERLDCTSTGVEIRQDAVGKSVPLDDIARVARYVECHGCLAPAAGTHDKRRHRVSTEEIRAVQRVAVRSEAG